MGATRDRGGLLTAGRGFELEAPWPTVEPGATARGGCGVKVRGGITRGATLLHASETGWPRSGETEATPSVPEPGQGCKGRRTLAAPKAATGGRRPGRLSCPEPRGLCPRHPLPRPRTLPPPPPSSHIPELCQGTSRSRR